MNNEFLKKHPVFWSRLGFCYDPPLKNSDGKPLVFTEDFSAQLSTHRDFIAAGVKIHTCILHLGWVGVDEYDYSLTDRVLDSLFSTGDDIYFIPRIKLNVPVDWCRENPEDVFVYYGGPKTKEEIAALVGTPKQDYFGYDAPDGYYRSGDYVDTRANVGGVIARQSFSSEKWLADAGEALSRLIDRLENGKYADRIIGYHIAYGTSGETILWGRISKRYGDYGINNRRAFYRFGLSKYGSNDALANAWGRPNISEDNLLLPTPDERAGKRSSLEAFMRADATDTICIDYDEFTSNVNASALEYFAKIVKEKTGKLVGAFYGYSLYISDAAYSGHLALGKLLESPYVDFFSSPKSYARSGVGEPGGEICPAQSINLSKVFLEELDNRTYLALENAQDIKDGFVAKDLSDTLWVMWREFAKNLAHDSGFWWMDLGGGWFSSPPLMSAISDMVKLNERLRAEKHSSRSDMLVLFDERSMMHTRESADLHKGFLREFINECNLSGVLFDVYRADDISSIDLSRYRLIVFAHNFYMSKQTREAVSAIPESTTLAFSYAAGMWSEKGYDPRLAEKITSHKIMLDSSSENPYNFPRIKAQRKKGGRKNTVAITEPYMKSDEIRSLARSAGCHVYTDTVGVTLYGDSRFLGVFTSGEKGEIRLPERASYRDLISGALYEDTDTVVFRDGKNIAMLLTREN